MRILVCTTDGSGAFNGINSWLLEFLPCLVAAGLEVRVLLFAWSPAERCHTYPMLRAKGIDARVIFPMLYTEAAVRRCLREVKDFRPDVFVPNMVTPALLAMPAVQHLRVPCVSILHNDDGEYAAIAKFAADATVAISTGLLKFVPEDGRRLDCIRYMVRPASATAKFPLRGSPFRLIYHGRIVEQQKQIVKTAAALVWCPKSNRN